MFYTVGLLLKTYIMLSSVALLPDLNFTLNFFF